MVYIRSRKFLCCIPVRAGVFVSNPPSFSILPANQSTVKVLSAIGTAGGTFISIMGWMQVSQLSMFSSVTSVQNRTKRNLLELHPLSTTDTIALYVYSVTFTILALLSLFG